MTDARTTGRRAIVVGCGIAGPVAAIALQRAGFDPVIYEARETPLDLAGGWLSLAPNGRNALATLGLDDATAGAGHRADRLIFHNAAGKRLGVLDRTSEAQRFGAAPIVIKRGLLHRALRESAMRQGIPVAFGKRLTDVALRPEGGVIAHFADGDAAAADLLLGCDGIHSPTRRFVLPDAPAPTYTGIVGFSGFCHPNPPIPHDGSMSMTFGNRAFVGTFAAPNGEVYWYDNVPWPREPAPGELGATGDPTLRARLQFLHAEDPAPIPEIVRATTSDIGTWVIYDIPSLAAWSRGPVCLVGDAAHATSPHGAQGASLALEDAVLVAKCLRDCPTIEMAFAAYERQRKTRVERQVRQARRTGAQNVAANPVALWMRDRLLPLFLKRGERANDWLHAYRVDWEVPFVA